MRGYNRVDEDLDEYEEEGLDDYGIEGEEYSEGEEEGVEEEDPTPKKEVLEYLELRQKLKEAARKNSAKQSGSGSNARDSKRTKLDKFGSFFGPSRPVISERVIQESKSFLETRQEAPRVSSSQKDSKRGQVPGKSAHNNGMTVRRPRPLNPIKEKVQKLKVTRDYSFLLSDDADIPGPTNAPGAANAHRVTNDPPARSNSGARPVQVQSKSRESGNSSRRLPDGAEERRPGAAGNSYHRPSKNALHQKPSSSFRSDSRRPERPAIPEQKRHPPVNGHGSGTIRPNVQKDFPLKNGSQLVKKVTSHMDRKMSSAPVERRVPSAASLERRPSTKIVKAAVPNVQRPQLSKSQANGVRPHLEERMNQSSKSKILSKQTSSSSKSQAPKQVPSRLSREEELHRSRPQPKLQPRLKPRPVGKFVEEEDDDELDAMAQLRKLTGYNPSKFAGQDDDVSDMEADFDTILMEEDRSLRIARQEDERELKLIQEEEERLRRRKLAKRKMSQR